MNIHEYQAKQLLRDGGVATPRGFPCFGVDEAVAAARELGGSSWVVKAQIHAGGRGKGGGVKLAHSPDEVRAHAGAILGMQLVTHQTGAAGRTVRRLLVEEAADIANELYLGMLVDRGSQQVAVIASSEGGTEIEEVAAHTPHKIHKVLVDPAAGLGKKQAGELAGAIGVPQAALAEARDLLARLYRVFHDNDASLVEVNPLIVTGGGHLVALDAKIVLDDNALFRHEHIRALRDTDEEDPAELEAAQVGLSYISLDGNIGCLVNGAGLAMATMDIIKLYGGSPANFLDVGGGATREQVAGGFRIMLQNPELRAILVNIFGGIMRCDVLANGLVEAVRETDLRVPLVVRLEGTNVEIGRNIIAESGLPIISASDMAEAAAKVVEAAVGHETTPAA